MLNIDVCEKYEYVCKRVRVCERVCMRICVRECVFQYAEGRLRVT